MRKNVKRIIVSALVFVFILSSMSLGALAASSFINKQAVGTQDNAYGTKFPVVSINLGGGKTLGNVNADSDHSDWVTDSSFSLTLDGATLASDTKTSFRGRGNHTWTLEKKGYAIKLDKKIDLLGMGKSKKWNLLASWYDKTAIRNWLSLGLSESLRMPFSPETRFVQLVVNGQHLGLYLLTEKVEIDAERANVQIGDGKPGALCEIDNLYGNAEPTKFSCNAGLVVIKEPEADAFSSQAAFDQFAADTGAYVRQAEATFNQGYAAYSQYIDVPSFVDWYIFHEFNRNNDSAFQSSCNFTRGDDGKLYMGPVWDYDIAFGGHDASSTTNPVGWSIKDRAVWFNKLMADPTFLNLVKERWTELKANGTFNNFLEDVKAGYDLAKVAKLKDFILWPNSKGQHFVRPTDITGFDYDQEYDYLRRFISERMLWLDSQWNTAPNTQDNLLSNFMAYVDGLPARISGGPSYLAATGFKQTDAQIRPKVDAALAIYNQLDSAHKAQLSSSSYAYEMAMFGDALDYFSIPYSPTLVSSVALNSSSLEMNVGNTSQLTATVLPSTANNASLTWSTSSSSVATVNETGLVTAVGAGTATITATAKDGSGKFATCSVTVGDGFDYTYAMSLTAQEAYHNPTISSPIKFDLNVANSQFAYSLDIGLTYDPSVLTYTGYTVANLGGTDNLGFMELRHTNVNGKIRLLAGFHEGINTQALLKLITFNFNHVTSSPALQATVTLDSVKVGVVPTDDPTSARDIAAPVSSSAATTQFKTLAQICDINGSGGVDIADLSIVMKYYTFDSNHPNWESAKKCDVNADGIVDMADLIIILSFVP